MSARGQLKGRRVLVKLVNGTKFVDTFVDNTSRQVIFKEHGRISRDQIKKTIPYVEEGFVWERTRDPNGIDDKQAKDIPSICPMRNWSSGPGWVTCMKPLDDHGTCTEHGKVRYTVTEAARAAKERQEKEPPSMRKAPPRRGPGGRTMPRKLHNQKAYGF
jgi:hypothetical protein